MLDRIGFIVGEAFIAIRRNPSMAFAAITTAAIAMFLLGGLGYVYFRVTEYAATLPGKMEMQVFLRDGADFTMVKAVAAQIRAVPGVREVSWIPRAKRWEKEQRERPELTIGIENPFPEAFKVIVRQLADTDSVAERIRGMAEVDAGGVVYLQKEQRFIEESTRVLRWLGGTVGGLLMLTAGVLIYNGIRLTALSRRLEVRVMRLVGASRLTIDLPFLIEGILQGGIGGVFAAGLLFTCNLYLNRFLATFDALPQSPTFPIVLILGALAGVGAGYGLVCSWLAIRMPVKA